MKNAIELDELIGMARQLDVTGMIELTGLVGLVDMTELAR